MCVFLCKYQITSRRFYQLLPSCNVESIMEKYKSRIMFGSERKNMWPLHQISMSGLSPEGPHRNIQAGLQPFGTIPCMWNTDEFSLQHFPRPSCLLTPLQNTASVLCCLVTRQLSNCAGHTASLRRVNASTNSEGKGRSLLAIPSHGMHETAVQICDKVEIRRPSCRKWISGLPEYEDGGSACSTAAFKGQNFVTCISQRSPPTREISLHLSLVSSRMKLTTDDTIQVFRRKKAILSIENVQKNIKVPHTASSKDMPPNPCP